MRQTPAACSTASCAVSAVVAFALATAIPESVPSLIRAPIVLIPAGLAYMGLSRAFGVPEAKDLTAKFEAYLPGRGKPAD